MKLAMNSTEFVSIAKAIQNGCPAWAVLRANEYLKQDDVIRKALLSKARSKIKLSKETSLAILDQGKSFHQLEKSQQREVLEHKTNLRLAKKTALVPSKRSCQPRRAVSFYKTRHLSLSTSSRINFQNALVGLG